MRTKSRTQRLDKLKGETQQVTTTTYVADVGGVGRANFNFNTTLYTNCLFNLLAILCMSVCVPSWLVQHRLD